MDTDNRSFKRWNAQEVEKTFGIHRTKKSKLLDQWLESQPAATPFQLQSVEYLRAAAEDDIDAWNEAALKFFFIGPLVALIDFNEQDYHGFLEQQLVIEQEGVQARGNIDFMVASGREVAEAPYYVLHEYKPETTAVLDPKGQLLIGMIAAQRANEARGLTQPVYGSYVIGRLWFFVLLNGKEYTISRAYDCTLPDGVDVIFRALLQVKMYIVALHEEMKS